MHTESILPSSWSLNIVFCTDSDSVLCNHHGSDHLSYPDHTLSCGNDWAASHPHKSENDLSSPCHWSVSLCYHGCHSRQFYSTLAWCNSEISWKGRNERIEFPNKIKSFSTFLFSQEAEGGLTEMETWSRKIVSADQMSSLTSIVHLESHGRWSSLFFCWEALWTQRKLSFSSDETPENWVVVWEIRSHSQVTSQRLRSFWEPLAGLWGFEVRTGRLN